MGLGAKQWKGKDRRLLLRYRLTEDDLEWGLRSGDEIIVDCEQSPHDGDLVLACGWANGFTAGLYHCTVDKDGYLTLYPGEHYVGMAVDDLNIIGTVCERLPKIRGKNRRTPHMDYGIGCPRFLGGEP